MQCISNGLFIQLKQLRLEKKKYNELSNKIKSKEKKEKKLTIEQHNSYIYIPNILLVHTTVLSVCQLV